MILNNPKRRFFQFARTVSVLDHGVCPLVAIRRKASRHESRYRTAGKRSTFAQAAA